MTTFLAFTIDGEGRLAIAGILEAKPRYRPRIWSRLRRMAIAGEICRVDVLTTPTSSASHTLRSAGITGSWSRRATTVSMIDLAADCRRKGFKRDARLILEDLRHERAGSPT